MLFTYNQLKQFIDTDLSPVEIENVLTSLGLEIEDVNDMTEKLKDFVVGEVVECKNHPNSDHLHVLKVNDGKNILDVVCGAPNVRKGLKGIFAPVGSCIPRDNFKLKKCMIRGKESNGMMCSEEELLLGNDSDGIIDLQIDCKAGDSAECVLSKIYNLDVVYDGNVLPNRPDYLGVLGIAKDLVAAGKAKLKEQKNDVITKYYECPIKVRNEILDDVKEYNICYIKGVKNINSPKWLVDYLKVINKNSNGSLVDITNYVLYSYNRPLHVFDADKIKGDLIVCHAKAGEHFIGLDGIEYTLNEGDIVVKDDNGIQALAGIMGGKNSSCSKDTKNVLLESAYFDPIKIRKTAKLLKIETDSKYRFERGVDPAFVDEGMEIAITHIVNICGGEVSKIYKTGENSFKEYEIEYPVPYFKKHIGFDISKKEMIKILENLNCKVIDNGDILSITPPSYRADLQGKHDINEELLRIYGFDKLPEIELKYNDYCELDYKLQKKVKLSRVLASRGMVEIYSWSFMSDKWEFETENSIKILNPITKELNVMRKSIIPNLLLGVKSNLDNGIYSSNLFEIGPVFYGNQPKEQNIFVSGIRQGTTGIDDWNKNKKVDFYDLKNDVFAIFENFGISENSVFFENKDLPEFLHPFQSANIIFAGKKIGIIGAIHPMILKKFGIKNKDVFCFEINLDEIMIKKRKGISKNKCEISELLPIVRDFSVIIDEDITAQEIINKVQSVNKKYISDVIIFDLYRGDKIEIGKKSVAIKIVIDQKDKIFIDDDINDIFNLAIERVCELGGILRDK